MNVMIEAALPSVASQTLTSLLLHSIDVFYLSMLWKNQEQKPLTYASLATAFKGMGFVLESLLWVHSYSLWLNAYNNLVTTGIWAPLAPGVWQEYNARCFVRTCRGSMSIATSPRSRTIGFFLFPRGQGASRESKVFLSPIVLYREVCLKVFWLVGKIWRYLGVTLELCEIR